MMGLLALSKMDANNDIVVNDQEGHIQRVLAHLRVHSGSYERLGSAMWMHFHWIQGRGPKTS